MKIHNLRHSLKKLLLQLGFHKYPDFLIIGTQKAGTTFLYSVLRQHPQIIEPVNKEAHFFDYDWNYQKGLDQYKLNFDLSFRFKKNQKTFEATPDYLAHPLAAERISKQFPKMKFIISLREPSSRAYSAWKMHHYLFKDHERHSWLYDPRTFEMVVKEGLNSESDNWGLMNHIARSLYGLQIENFMKYFPKENFLIFFQDQLNYDLENTINEICNFIEIDSFSLNNLNREDSRFWENKSKNTATDKNFIPFQKELLDFYKDDNKLLQKLIEKETPW